MINTAKPKIPLPSIQSIIAVVSGKGGVGKSTFSFFLASLLAKKGMKIGLLDADIYGPSLPKLMGIKKKPTIGNQKFIPFEKNGLKGMSMGFLLDEHAPLIWRGPMVQTAVKQLFQDVEWGPLDLLVVDMPPGTGDAHLTLAQSIPLMGVIVITTPQELSTLDAAKSLNMYQTLQIPILGIIENMKGVTCPCCEKTFEIFSGNGGQDLAQKFAVPYLGAIPLDPKIVASIENEEDFSQTSSQTQTAYEKIAQIFTLQSAAFWAD